jgi:tmRNA-binding protein
MEILFQNAHGLTLIALKMQIKKGLQKCILFLCKPFSERSIKKYLCKYHYMYFVL